MKSSRSQNKIAAEAKTNIPVLQFSVLCDGFSQDQVTHKLSLIGVFDMFYVGVNIPQFVVVNRFIYGKGDFNSKIIIRSPDLSKIIAETAPQEFILEKETSIANMIAGFVDLKFESEGVYWFEIYLDDTLILSYPVPVSTLEKK